MTKYEVLAAVNLLMIENCEWHDWSPQRYLIDGIDKLVLLTCLFEKIYQSKQIPQQGCYPKSAHYLKKETLLI